MDTALEEYIIEHSDKESACLAEVNRRTHLRMINPRMMSGHLQGRLLAMFCRMIQPSTVLELGTYSGYSAICMAEATANHTIIHTIEHNDELEDFITENINDSEFGYKIRLHIGDALEKIRTFDAEYFDMAFIDADKRQYTDYYLSVLPKLKKGGFIIVDNTLWDGKVVHDNIHHNDKQTLEILHFNDIVAQDKRVEKVIVPMRDGLTIIRKK
ncbi:MAG: O-methyltransferase [Prevotellaceae bacterium]|jgi:predicted O-methyltransferase YrrM|nr:O-methyltransferase [Prevotellaceae bacterium]